MTRCNLDEQIFEYLKIAIDKGNEDDVYDLISKIGSTDSMKSVKRSQKILQLIRLNLSLLGFNYEGTDDQLLEGIVNGQNTQIVNCYRVAVRAMEIMES